jgi:lysophospholipid acyltransferase (LPLAT)-like uncharacterized protein
MEWICVSHPPARDMPASALPERAIILLWHEHLPICIRAFARLGIHVLISRSSDGAWAADACQRFGYGVHRGSSTRGSLDGMRALARAMETENVRTGMALDGPRGPRRTVKPGSLWLARRAQAPVVPVWVETSVGFRLNSWDRCVIPWPFSKVVIHMGEAIFPADAEEIVQAMAELETPGLGSLTKPFAATA